MKIDLVAFGLNYLKRVPIIHVALKPAIVPIILEDTLHF